MVFAILKILPRLLQKDGVLGVPEVSLPTKRMESTRIAFQATGAFDPLNQAL
jgi:hypothetical protein